MATRTVFIVAAAIVGGLVAWGVVGALPPAHVLVGMAVRDELVPAVYQVCVFPAFAAFAAALGVDVLRGIERRSWPSRAALLLVTSILGLVRLGGRIPLSGHALFLAAVLAYELARSTSRTKAPADAHLLSALVVPALLVTGWYKLVVWGDPLWFTISLIAGMALGLVLERRAKVC